MDRFANLNVFMCVCVFFNKVAATVLENQDLCFNSYKKEDLLDLRENFSFLQTFENLENAEIQFSVISEKQVKQ